MKAKTKFSELGAPAGKRRVPPQPASSSPAGRQPVTGGPVTGGNGQRRKTEVANEPVTGSTADYRTLAGLPAKAGKQSPVTSDQLSGGQYPAPTPPKPAMRTRGEASISTERVTLSVRMRFNPLRGLTPERLAQYLEQFDLGFFRMAAITWDKIERRDHTLKTVIPKRKKAVARHGYDVLTQDKLADDQKALAEAQQKELKFFYDNLTATNAIRPDEQGGMALLVRQMMDAQGKLYAVHEIVWQPRPEGLTAQLVFCPLWWFEGVTGKLRYLDNEFQVYGRDMAPSEWLITVGEGLMEASSVAWMFKHLSLQDWLVYCEKFGQPFIDAATSASPGSEDWDALIEYVQNFGPDGGGVRSQSATIQMLEPKGTSTQTYSAMVENMDRALILLWRGGDLGTQGGKDKTGASLQGDESDILEGDDAVLIEEQLALQISRFVIAWKFGPGTPVLAYLKFKQEQDPEAVTFQREVYKALLADGTVADVLANQADLKKLTQDVGIPVNEEYTDPYLPVLTAAGGQVTGDLVKDGDDDIIGAEVEAETTGPQTTGPLDRNGKGTQAAPGTPGTQAEIANSAPTIAEPNQKLIDSGVEHYARAVASDLEQVRSLVAGLLQIADDRVLGKRALEVADEIRKLQADILALPKAAQALAEVQIAALFQGLTEGNKGNEGKAEIQNGAKHRGGHYIEQCSCGAVISQCRCSAKDKKVITTPNGCAECKAKTTAENAKSAEISNGDVPGHEFHGNQYADAVGKINDVRGGKAEEAVYGKVTPEIAAKIKAATGREVSGYQHLVDRDALTHINRQHGVGKEDQAGHEPVTAADLERIPEIVDQPDKVEDGGLSSRGRPTIKYSKKSKGTTYFVEEEWSKEKVLAAKTMWKKRAGE